MIKDQRPESAQDAITMARHLIKRTAATTAVMACFMTMGSSTLYAQESTNAALERACRATEVTVPDSCPCTISKARDLGLGPQQLASLLKSEDHSPTADQAVYAQFWQVKLQCIAEATMADLGITPSQVPATMPPIPSRLPKAGNTNMTTGSDRRLSADVETIRVFKNFDFIFSYSKSLENEPLLMMRANQAAEAKLETLTQRSTELISNFRQSHRYAWTVIGEVGPLVSIGISESSGNRPQASFSGALLWNSELDREIAWTDVFETRLWNGGIRREYCAGLQSERTKRGNQLTTNCPSFDQLQIALQQNEDETLRLVFTALAYVAGSYAEGPYDVILELDSAWLAGVKPEYRKLLRASEKGSSVLPIRARLGNVKGEVFGDAGCTNDLFLLPPGIRPTQSSQFDRLIRSQPRIATIVDDSGGTLAWKVNFDGTIRLLTYRTARADGKISTYGDDTLAMTVSKGRMISDNPAIGYSIDRVIIELNHQSEQVEAIGFSAC